MSNDNHMPSPAFCVSVFDAAKTYGSASVAIIALLKSGSVTWTDPASVEPVHYAFMQGSVAGILAISREAAIDVLARKGFVKGKAASIERRDEAQQNAYRAAITRWSYAAQAAGMPSRVTGAPRPGKNTKSAKAKAAAKAAKLATPIALQAVVVPKAKTFDDVKMFARNVAALMRKFENANAAASFGEYRNLIDGFVDGVTALGKAEAEIDAKAKAA